MSTAWYKPNAIPTLVGSFVSRNKDATKSTSSIIRREVQVWNTTCAVTRSGKTTSPMNCTVLINPANPQLQGVSTFPYFPRGGPAPKEYPKKDAHHIMGHVSQWGGMEVGDGMLFAANVVDGLVHQLGGWRLQYECGMVPIVDSKSKDHDDDDGEEDVRCPVGQAVLTGPGIGTDLAEHFDHIVHAVPPFYNHHPEPESYLLECYQNAFSVAFDDGGAAAGANRVACPLVGSGCRGFPMDIALKLAGTASVQWMELDDTSIIVKNDADGAATNTATTAAAAKKTLAFAIPDQSIADELVKGIFSQAERSGNVKSAT